MSMRVIFFGTSDFAVPALKTLHDNDYEIAAVVTVPDKPVGRKQIMTAPPAKLAALELGILVHQPASLKKDEQFFELFKSWQPDICIVASYGKIIPERYIEIPKHGFINIHPSLLPKYRGPSPIQTAILNGETETGVTIMVIDKDMDHGPILTQQEFSIFNFQFSNSKELENKLSKIGAELLLETIPKYVDGEIKPQEQNHDKATFTKILERADGRIDWSQSAEKIYNQIRALNPEPGTWATWNGKILNIKSAIIANDGHLEILKLQLEGKKETSFKEFCHGYPNFKISDLS